MITSKTCKIVGVCECACWVGLVLNLGCSESCSTIIHQLLVFAVISPAPNSNISVMIVNTTTSTTTISTTYLVKPKVHLIHVHGLMWHGT